MLEERGQIRNHIQKYMTAAGYTLSPKSKDYHALDSLVYEYRNAGGVKDNLKIEINYMLRCHVMPVTRRKVNLPWNEERLTVLSVEPLEIFSAKAMALLNRAAPRDLYDMFNMQKFGLFDETEEQELRKCIMFYAAVASEKVPKEINLERIGKISAQKIKTDLTPVLRRGERLELENAQEQVKEFLSVILRPTEEEMLFWRLFSEGDYRPELLFGEGVIADRIKAHPMALWKCNKNRSE